MGTSNHTRILHSLCQDRQIHLCRKSILGLDRAKPYAPKQATASTPQPHLNSTSLSTATVPEDLSDRPRLSMTIKLLKTSPYSCSNPPRPGLKTLFEERLEHRGG